MRNIIKIATGMIMAMVMSLSTFTGFTSLAANYNQIDMSKARFEVALNAIDTDTGLGMVFALYEYNGVEYAYVNKYDDGGFFAPVTVTDIKWDGLTGAQQYSMPDFDYYIIFGMVDNQMVIMDNNNFFGLGTYMTAADTAGIIANS